MAQIKRILIEGEKVHNVGYRPFLLWKVRELGILNHDARNVKENGMQRVVVSVQGEENQLNEFVEFAKDNYPDKARVSSVREIEPPGRVMSVDDYDKILSAEQQNTVIQTGLVMIDMHNEALGNQRKMLGKQDQTIESINKGFSETRQDFNRMDIKYDKVSGKMDSIDNTLKELTKAILKLAEKS